MAVEGRELTSKPTPLLLSWSGGKDAAWALHTLRHTGEFEVVGLLTTFTRGFDRVAIQGIRREVVQAQACAAGLPLIESWIGPACDNDAYVRAFTAALREAERRWPPLRHIAFGDLLLAEVRAWREQLCESLGWQAVFPLFGRDTATLAKKMIAGGLRATLCCVDATQLDASFAGRAFDHALLSALPPGCDRCGENGEFHTCVSAGPMFAELLSLTRGGTVLREARFHYTDFLLG